MQNRKLLFVLALSGLLIVYAFNTRQKANDKGQQFISRLDVFRNKSIMQCSVDWSLLDSDSLATGISILPGWGNYKWNIASSNDSARLYFQQGISMYYSFHLIEAMASFKKAAKFDDKDPMIYWAQALAYGPNINDYEYFATPDAVAASKKASELSGKSTPKEKALIQAMSVRYSMDSTISRSYLNEQYTNAMKKIHLQMPMDADIAALYADAMMLQHPWEYWKHDGNPHPWTPAILQVLESALKTSPIHPGANHYYIHMVEASPKPQRALASADRLSKLMPSVSHMVHMPSHIYIRSGLYKQGIRVNELSLKGYKDYLAAFPDVANNVSLYLIHNLHMRTACAMLGDGYDYSSKSAEECRASFDTSFMSLAAPLGTYVQYVYMTPVINNVKFGKWDEVLTAPAISGNYVYANTLWHWAKGMAHARKNNFAEARNELELMKANLQKPDMLVVMQPFNSPEAAANVAAKLLEGVIAEQANDLTTAAAALKQAVKSEDALIYNEPRDWLLPVRPYLGAILLKAGSYAEAEKIFKADLQQNPNNHWGLAGFHQALQKQSKNREAFVAKKQLEKNKAPGESNLTIVY